MVLWLAAIFYFSSRPEPLVLVASAIPGADFLDEADPAALDGTINSPEKEHTASILNPIAHFGEYAGLAFVLFRALASDIPERRRSAGTFLATLLLTVAIAAADEMYQQTIPQRGFELFDVLADTLGGLSAVGLLWIAHMRR